MAQTISGRNIFFHVLVGNNTVAYYETPLDALDLFAVIAYRKRRDEMTDDIALLASENEPDDFGLYCKSIDAVVRDLKNPHGYAYGGYDM